MLHISLAGERLFSIAGMPVTNSLLTTWIVMAILTLLAVQISSDIKLVPSRFQVVGELIIGGMYTTFHGILGHKTAQYFPLVMTFFLFIIASNWFGLIPGVGSIGIKEGSSQVEELDGFTLTALAAVPPSQDHAIPDVQAEEEHKETIIPLLRAPTADLNTTFALAIISVVAIQVAGIQSLGGAAYLGKFITFKDPISFYVGILELVSELGKVLSFAFRLFGNIFAGEVLLAVVAFLIPYFAPIPFLGLEIFVGFIQALVFAMLTSVFLAAATSHSAH